MRKVDYAILGGGVAGLGFYKGLGTGTIFEKDSRPGGHIKSKNVHGYTFDQGAHICHSKDSEWLEMITSNSLDINEKTSNVLNLKDDLIFEYPVQNNLFRQSEKLRSNILKELWDRDSSSRIAQPNNYKDWLVGQYGQTLYDKFYNLYTSKYWRTKPDIMGIDWLSGRLINIDKEKIISGLFSKPLESQAVFNRFKYPKQGGFESFFSHLYNDVPVELNHNVERIDIENKVIDFSDKPSIKYDKLASSLPLNILVKRLHPPRKDLISLVDRLKYLNLIQINLVLKPKGTSQLSNADWFYIYDENIDISRVSLLNNVRGVSKNLIVQAEIFRRNDELKDVQSLVTKGISDLLRIFKCNKNDIVSSSHLEVEHTYPVPLIDSPKVVSTLKTELENLEIYTFGVYGNWNYTFSDLTYKNAYEYGKKFS